MAGTKAYIMINGKLVEETCTESPATCTRHRAWHNAQRDLRGVREEYVKAFFDTSDLPEKEKAAKADFQEPNRKRIGLAFQGEAYTKHKELAQALADKLTDEEKESVLFYSNNGYKDIMNYIYGRPRRVISIQAFADGSQKENLAGGNDVTDEEWNAKMERHVQNVNKAIGLAGEQAEPEILYRAMVLNDDNYVQLERNQMHIDEEAMEEFIPKYFKVGEVFHRKAVTSTSSDPTSAVTFFLNHGSDRNGSGVIIEYKTRRGARLSKEAGTSRVIHEEFEVLLPPRQEFRVVAVHKNVKYSIDARKRFQDRGMKKDRFGKVVAPKVTLIQVEEID
jgi:hypothetical protein